MAGTPTSQADQSAIAQYVTSNGGTDANVNRVISGPTDRVNGVSVNPNVPSVASPNSTNQPPTGVQPTGGATATTPVVTSAAAKADAAQKYQTWQSLQAQVANQQSVLAQQAAQKAANDAKATSDAAQLKIQQQEADTNAQTAATKAAAVAAANAPTTDTTTTNTTGTDGTTGTTTTNTTTPTPPVSTSPDYQGALNNATDNYLSSSQGIQGQQDSLATQMSTQLGQLLAGTIPLSAPQQALVTSLQNQLTQNEAQQTVANQSYTGAVTESAMRSGGEYTPTQTAGLIQNAVSVGVAKIQALDNSAASTIAKIESDFQTQDFDIINKNYDVLSKQLDDKASALKDTYDTVTKAIQDQRDTEASAAKTAFDENLQSSQFDFTKSQAKIDDMFKQGQLTETERHDMQDEANQAAQTQIAAQKENLDQATWNATYGGFLNPDGTVNTSVTPQQIPGFTKTPNGSSVVLDTNGLYKATSLAGVPVVSKDNIAGFTSNAKAASTINQMQILYNQMSQKSDTTQSSQIPQYTALYNSLPKDIQASVPSVNTGLSGFLSNGINASKGNPQFSTVLSSVNSNLGSLAPGYTPPPYGQTFTSPQDAQSYFTSTGQGNEYASEVQKANSLAQKEFGRNANDGEVMQIINGQ